MESVLLIVLGWLLGIIGPGIIERIKGKYRKDEIKKGIAVELSEFKFRMAGTAFLARSYIGEFERPFLEWLERIRKNYKGVYHEPKSGQSLDELLKLNNEQIKNVALLGKEKQGVGISIKTYSVPFLENNISALTLFKPPLQGKLLELQSQLSFFNQEIGNMRFYDQTMFTPGISEENHNILRINFLNSVQFVAESSERIVGFIEKIELEIGGY